MTHNFRVKFHYPTNSTNVDEVTISITNGNDYNNEVTFKGLDAYALYKIITNEKILRIERRNNKELFDILENMCRSEIKNVEAKNRKKEMYFGEYDYSYSYPYSDGKEVKDKKKRPKDTRKQNNDLKNKIDIYYKLSEIMKDLDMTYYIGNALMCLGEYGCKNKGKKEVNEDSIKVLNQALGFIMCEIGRLRGENILL